MLSPSEAKYPHLSERWATALSWLSEGGRESNDFIAVAKIGSSIDVLSCGGKAYGLTNMLAHLMAIDRTSIVTSGPTPKSLEQLMRQVYEAGRSQILHGTHVDRLKSFAETKAFASQLATIALLECATRLSKYSGPDNPKTFQTIPA